MKNKVESHTMSAMDKTSHDKDKEDQTEGTEDALEILKDQATNKQVELIHTTLKNDNFNTGRLLITEGLTKGTGVNYKDGDGKTALHIVTASNSPLKLDMIKWLVTEHQADPNIQDKHGKSALQLAIDIQEDETVLVFLQRGKVEHNASLLLDIAKLDGSRSLEHFLKENPEGLKTRDSAGETVLHVAVEHGVLQSVEMILKLNQDLVKEQDKQGRQVIHIAAHRGDLDIMTLLLENGASPDVLSQQGSPLCIAAQKGHEDIISYLLENVGDIDVQLKNYQGETALHLAVRGGHLKSCRLLLQHPGFPVTSTNNRNQTVLHYVAQFTTWRDWEIIVDDVVKKGVQYLHQDSDGHTALHLAVEHNNEYITKRLLKLLEQESDS
jgi:ankyrin repeat protein